MFRSLYHLEELPSVPWKALSHLRWLIAAVTFLAIFLIGVGVINGRLQ